MLRLSGCLVVVASLSFAANPAFARAVAVDGQKVLAIATGETYQVADLIGDECRLWNKGCRTSCNNKVPKIVPGGAAIGGVQPNPNAPHNAFQRAQMMAQCQAECMKAYPLCK